MTDRGLPIVDGAPACPFVAFEEDRDGRATSPDHRHRCYAEVRPAPRALAHQEAFCLSSAFPVCPTFQDWARREAAKAHEEPAPGQLAAMPADQEDVGRVERGDHGATSPGQPHRNPRRDWAAPPPWLGANHEDADRGDAEHEVVPIPHRGGGLAGSLADRFAGGAQPDSGGPVHPAAQAPEPATAPDVPRERSRPLAPRNTSIERQGPAWERPRRREAYPTLKTRMGLGGFSVPPIVMGLVALVLAAVALFNLPGLLGVGNPPQASTTPTASAAPTIAGASETPFAPTPVPGPTQQIYLVQSGDTMSRIANRFGIPLQLLIDANKATIPNPDVLDVGQEVIIPSTTPTALPDAGGSPSPPP